MLKLLTHGFPTNTRTANVRAIPQAKLNVELATVEAEYLPVRGPDKAHGEAGATPILMAQGARNGQDDPHAMHAQVGGYHNGVAVALWPARHTEKPGHEARLSCLRKSLL